nr:hypothetical protein [Streptomyces armeniacus]
MTGAERGTPAFGERGETVGIDVTVTDQQLIAGGTGYEQLPVPVVQQRA